MKISKPTPLQAEWLAKLGLPGLANFEVPDAEVAEALHAARLQHGTKRLGHPAPEPEEVLKARALGRVAYRHFGRKRLSDQAPHPYLMDFERHVERYLWVIIALLVILLVLAILPGHAQTNKANAGPPSRANLWFWNGSAYVPVESGAPFPITCVSGCVAGGSFTDNSAFTGAVSAVSPIGLLYDTTPPAITDGNAGIARMDVNRYTFVNCVVGCSGGATTPTDAFANPTTAGLSFSFNAGWNGASWDRLQVDGSKFLKVNCATGCSGGASTPSDAFANPTTASLGMSFNMGWNGATWDRLKSTTANGLGVDVTRVQGNVAVTGTFFQATQPVSCATGPTCPVSVTTWGGGTLGAMANYGTTPGAVLVPGVNAFITNTVPVTLTSTTITGTVAATQSGNWTSRIVGNAGGVLDAIGQNVAGPANWLSAGCDFFTSPTAITNGNGSPFTCTAAGALRTDTTSWLGSTAPTVGQKTMANSVPVVLASDQAAIPVTMTSTTLTGTSAVNMTQWATTSLGTPTNFGTTPGAVIAGSVNASIMSGTTALGAPNTFGATAPTGNALGVNAALFVATTLAINDGTAGALGVGGHFADNGVAAATNRIPTLDCIYQTSYLNGTAATQGRNGAPSCGSDGLVWTANLPAMRPASYHASASIAGSSTTVMSALPGNASNTVLVTGIHFTCTQTTAGALTITVNKTSAAATGGTSAGMTEIPDDSGYAAASTAALTYTGTGPTAGTPVGQIDAQKVGCNAPATAGANDIYYLNLRQKPVVLRGTAQTLEIGAGGAVTGGNITITWDWIETATITP